jgi:hypothetical protein
MGLADRDYMHERRDTELPRKAFARAPASIFDSTLWAVLIWAAVAALLFTGFAWWEKTRRPPPPRSVVQQAIPANNQIGRGVSGAVATSASPSHDQRVQRQVTQPQAAAGSASALGSSVTMAMKCKVNGVVTYSDSACAGRSGTAVPLDANVNVADGLRQPSMGAPRFQTPAIAANMGPAPVEDAGNQAVAPHAAGTRQACAALDEEVRTIDARTRQALAASEQDYWAARRKKVRDAQFRLHC